MKIGFGKGKISDAMSCVVPTSAPKPPMDPVAYARARKFDISDRVEGIWRPKPGEVRRHVEDLLVTAMYGEAAEGPFVLLGLDQCELDWQQVDEIKTALTKAFGFKPERILCMASHCHVNVPFDAQRYREVIVATVRRAMAQSAEADVAAVHLALPDARRFSLNRRVHVDGVGTRTVMFNDGCETRDDRLIVTQQLREWIRNLGGNPDDFIPPGKEIAADGPVDNRLQALLFRNQKTGKALGTLVRFACHPVIVSEKKSGGDISADYPGHLRKRIEEALGGICLFGQGQCGEMRPLLRENSHVFAKEFGQKLADRILDAARAGLDWRKIERLSYEVEPLILPLRKDLPSDKQAATREMEKIEKRFDAATNIEARRRLQNLYWFYYRADDMRYCRPEWLQKGEVAFNIYGVRINDQVILGNHAEVFFETGQQMIRGFEDRHPITFSVCNESLSYIPSRDAFDKGGYEPSVCMVEPGSTDLYEAAAQRLLKRLCKPSA